MIGSNHPLESLKTPKKKTPDLKLGLGTPAFAALLYSQAHH